MDDELFLVSTPMDQFYEALAVDSETTRYSVKPVDMLTRMEEDVQVHVTFKDMEALLAASFVRMDEMQQETDALKERLDAIAKKMDYYFIP